MTDDHNIRDLNIGYPNRITQVSQRDSTGKWFFVSLDSFTFEDVQDGLTRSRLNKTTAVLRDVAESPDDIYDIGNTGDYLYKDPEGNLTIIPFSQLKYV